MRHLMTPTTSLPLVSVILATYNEAENIVDMIQAVLSNVRDPVEVIVVDDDSPDLTWKIAGEVDDPRVKIIRRVWTRGLASAVNRGLIESQGEIIAWMDADLGMPAELLPAMIERTKEVDVVIGSRYVEGGQDARPPIRVLTSRMINTMALLVLGYGIKDYDSGFIVMRRSVLNSVTLSPTGYGSYFIEFVYTCCRKGLTVFEIPYTFRDRTKGSSKSAIGPIQFLLAGAAYGLRILTTRIKRIE
jgi:dolichol-phosphate mannosyltransferase